jgi:nucleotide-binding universal stress UspA family protein
MLECTMSATPKTTILLAVDIAPGEPVWHAEAAADAARELVRDDADHVVVLHVREFSVTRLGRMMRDDGGADGRRAVERIVSRLLAGGVHACGEVREADIGHVAETILAAARDYDSRVLVVGACGHHGMRRIPVGSVAARLLPWSPVPVLVVPRQPQQQPA